MLQAALKVEARILVSLCILCYNEPAKPINESTGGWDICGLSLHCCLLSLQH